MKKSLFAVVVVILACASLTYAQGETNVIDSINSFTSYNVYDFDFVGGGTRAKGMGNAFIGVSNDVTGGSWNPAGLYELDKTTMGISWYSMTPKGVTTTQSISNFTELNHSGSFNNLSALNFISPIRISGHPFVFSLNLTRNFNIFKQFGYRLNVPREFQTVVPDVITYYDTNDVNTMQVVRQKGGLNSLNFAFGTRFRDNISFGVAVNIYTGKSIFNSESFTTVNDFRVNVVQFATLTENMIVEDTNEFSGANATIGFMYNGDKLDAGLTIRTPFSLKENRKQGLYIIDEINNVPTLTDTIFNRDILYEYEMPLMIGAGIGYHVNDNWLLAGDVEYRGFSGKKVNYRVSQTVNPGGNNIDSFIVIDPNWNNSFSIRLGSEYIKSFNFGDVPIRAGFGAVPIPGPSVDTSGISSTAINYNFTTGTGIHWNQIHLDIAYTYKIGRASCRERV